MADVSAIVAGLVGGLDHHESRYVVRAFEQVPQVVGIVGRIEEVKGPEVAAEFVQGFVDSAVAEYHQTLGLFELSRVGSREFRGVFAILRDRDECALCVTPRE